MRLLSLVVLGSTLLFGPAHGPNPVRHETAAERLHRKGVHCMEVLERRECAITNFEELLEERTNQRELVTDGLLRLITLYQKEGRNADVPDLLRMFWDVGMKRGSAGHVPHTTRYFPSEMNILVNLDPPRIVGSPIMKRLGADARDLVFTCDEARRNDIRERQRWRRAAKKAAAQGKSTWEVVYAERDRERERREKYERRSGGPDRSGPEPGPTGPIFLHAACPVAQALGQDDLLGWTRMTGAMNHQNASLSVAVAEIPGLAQRLEAAVAAGRLVPDGVERWKIPGFAYAGADVVLARLDAEELLVAPPGLAEGIIAARHKRRRQINRELLGLVDEVPRDTGFFMVMNQAAMRELGFASLKRTSRGMLEALLPRPKGLQVAAVFAEHAAVFTRVPTDNPVKARMLASLANTLLVRSAEGDADAAKWLAGLDIAESHDRRALLASYLASTRQLEELMFGG
jgi:hypothetical protein